MLRILRRKWVNQPEIAPTYMNILCKEQSSHTSLQGSSSLQQIFHRACPMQKRNTLDSDDEDD